MDTMGKITLKCFHTGIFFRKSVKSAYPINALKVEVHVFLPKSLEILACKDSQISNAMPGDYLA